MTELPVDLTTLSVFRSLTCHSNVIVITMPSTSAVAAFAAHRWLPPVAINDPPSCSPAAFTPARFFMPAPPLAPPRTQLRTRPQRSAYTLGCAVCDLAMIRHCACV